MNEFTIQILAGLVVATASGIAGYLLRQYLLRDRGVLPEAKRLTKKQRHAHLSGSWHLYWISYDPAKPLEAVWHSRFG